MRKLRKTLLALALAAFTLSASAFAAPKNIILLIGDGMGVGIISAARDNVENGKLVMDSFPYTGFSISNPYGADVTDSAASATAMATGFKTTNGRIGTSRDNKDMETILEAAHKSGRKTAIVTTKNITDATPACFMSHVESRSMLSDIAGEEIYSGSDVILGGGWEHFIPNTAKGSERKDARNIIEEATKIKGYTYVNTREDLLNTKATKLLGLFNPWVMDTFSGKEPTLTQMTMKAINIVNKNNTKGFFMMSEAGQIDSFLHANNFDKAMHEMLDFNDTIKAVLDFAKKDGNTLVIITADHDTGCLGAVDPSASEKAAGKKVAGVWATNNHTGNMIPIFAYGPGAAKFTGVHQNTEIPRIFAKYFNLKMF